MNENFVMINKNMFFHLLDSSSFVVNRNFSNASGVTTYQDPQDITIKNKVKALFNQCGDNQNTSMQYGIICGGGNC